MQSNLNPFTAILVGTLLGFAAIAPFGGLAMFNTANAGRVMTCDVMGCQVRSLRP